MGTLHGAEGSLSELSKNFELEHETLQDPVRRTLFQRNQVTLTLDLPLNIAETEFQPLSILTQMRKFRTQTYYVCIGTMSYYM